MQPFGGYPDSGRLLLSALSLVMMVFICRTQEMLSYLTMYVLQLYMFCRNILEFEKIVAKIETAYVEQFFLLPLYSQLYSLNH